MRGKSLSLSLSLSKDREWPISASPVIQHLTPIIQHPAAGRPPRTFTFTRTFSEGEEDVEGDKERRGEGKGILSPSRQERQGEDREYYRVN